MIAPASTSQSRRTRRAALIALTTLTLAGCSLTGASPERDKEWAEDPGSGKYYRPGVVLETTELLEEHFPELDGVQEATLAGGQFTDPYERVPIPAPDDYWWQAVLELGPAEVDQLLERLRAATSDGGGGVASEPDLLTDDEVSDALVPTIEEQISACPGGWIEVSEALTPDDHGNHTAAGDMIEMGALCEDTGQLMIAANDM